jgi:hypothetical protein
LGVEIGFVKGGGGHCLSSVLQAGRSGFPA